MRDGAPGSNRAPSLLTDDLRLQRQLYSAPGVAARLCERSSGALRVSRDSSLESATDSDRGSRSRRQVAVVASQSQRSAPAIPYIAGLRLRRRFRRAGALCDERE